MRWAIFHLRKNSTYPTKFSADTGRVTMTFYDTLSVNTSRGVRGANRLPDGHSGESVRVDTV